MKRAPTGSRPDAGLPSGPDKGLQDLSMCRGSQTDFGSTSGQPGADVEPTWMPILEQLGIDLLGTGSVSTWADFGPTWG